MATQPEFEGMPEPAGQLYVAGSVGVPEGFLDDISAAQIGDTFSFSGSFELRQVGEQKKKETGTSRFIKLQIVKAGPLT